jgi:vacuolar-type H+-ATPase subunit I/STV1
MKKGAEEHNSFGVAGVTLGILSIVLGLFVNPLVGIILGVIGLVFSKKQHQQESTKWSRAARTLSIIGIVAGVVVLILSVVASYYFAQNPDFLASLQGTQ